MKTLISAEQDNGENKDNDEHKPTPRKEEKKDNKSLSVEVLLDKCCIF